MSRRTPASIRLFRVAAIATCLGCAVSEPIDPDQLGHHNGATGLGGADGTGAAGSADTGGAGTAGGGTSATGIAGASGSAGATGSAGTGSSITTGSAGTGSSITSGQAGAGSSITSGQAGSGGTGAGGVSGQAGRGGSGAGGTGGGGGATGSGGRGGSGGGGRGGSTGFAGRGGQGGSAGAAGTAGGVPDGGSNPDAIAAPTFTQIYTTILVTYCAGSSCHNPGTQGGIGFSSQSSAYTAVRARVTPGNGTGSRFYMTVNSGSMPRGQAKLSADNLNKIKTWIDAGALNN